MTIHEPVINPDLFEAKNATRSPNGSGHPNLPIGKLSLIKPSTTSGEFSFWNLSQLPSGTSIEPGAMEFTNIPSLAKEIAECFVAAINAAYADI